MYAFDTVNVWKDKYTTCVTSWNTNVCIPFFQKYAPAVTENCNKTLSYMQSQISGLFDFAYSAYGYGYYYTDNRHVGLKLSSDVTASFNWLVGTTCATQNNSIASAKCMLDGLNVTQGLSCNHAMYANSDTHTAASALNYAIPALVTMYLCLSNMQNEVKATHQENTNKPKLLA